MHAGLANFAVNFFYSHKYKDLKLKQKNQNDSYFSLLGNNVVKIKIQNEKI
jgi:replicative superfamily II helicase